MFNLNFGLLTEKQKNQYQSFCEFVREHVEPYAETWEKNQGVPRDIIDLCGKNGFVGGIIPKEYGGGGWDAVTFGLLNEAFGAASSSLCALFTVQIMGAAGCHEENPAASYYRNAKIMEIIEGTNQVQQQILGKSFCKKYRKTTQSLK